MKRFFSHLPAWVEAFASGICRARANIIAMACSAVVIELPNGVFMTITPCAVAAGISTLSTPMPARPTTLSLLARSSSFGVTFVAERMARPSYAPITSASLSLSLPRLASKVTSMPRSLKIWMAAGERASEIRTLGADIGAPGGLKGSRQAGFGSKGLHKGRRKFPSADCRSPTASQAAFFSLAFSATNARSIQGSSALTSRVWTVAPHQMRRPGGASR
jgi:hypothetical protein